MTGNDQCVIRGSKEMTIFLNNSLFKNEMLQKTAEMYEQDKKELRYEVRNFIFYCENHMTNVKLALSIFLSVSGKEVNTED